MQINISEYEMKLVTDTQVLLTKNRIIQKVMGFFGTLSTDYKAIITDKQLAPADSVNAKVSRGENYKGLPYVMLDYPRLFERSNTFAIRTLFWWGNFFSITLQLSGEYQQKFSPIIQKAICEKQLKDWYIATSENAWEHHFDDDNYQLINYEREYFLTNLPFIKISKKIPLEQWDKTEVLLKENFKTLIEMISG